MLVSRSKGSFFLVYTSIYLHLPRSQSNLQTKALSVVQRTPVILVASPFQWLHLNPEFVLSTETSTPGTSSKPTPFCQTMFGEHRFELPEGSLHEITFFLNSGTQSWSFLPLTPGNKLGWGIRSNLSARVLIIKKENVT